jgi:hypothetical protein
MSGGTRHQLRWGTQAATTKPGVRKSSGSNSSNSSNSGGGSNSGTFATAVPTYPPRNPDHVGGLSKATFGRRTRKEDRDAALLALAVLDAAPDNTLEHFVNEVVQPRWVPFRPPPLPTHTHCIFAPQARSMRACATVVWGMR